MMDDEWMKIDNEKYDVKWLVISDEVICNV